MGYKFAKTDSNHKEIVSHFRSIGFHVLDISRLKNCCDLVVTGLGKTFYVEVKDGQKVASAKKLTPGEVKFMLEVKSTGGLWYQIESQEDVNNLYKELLRGKK